MGNRAMYEGPYVWAAKDWAAANEGGGSAMLDVPWRLSLSPAAVDEILLNVQRLRTAQIARDELTGEDFPLPVTRPVIETIDHLLADGPGFVVLSGLPVATMTREDIELAFCGLGAALGTSVSQSFRGDRLGRVMDIGEPGRYYTVGGALEMHMDPVDAVGLLCLRKAIAGGESRIASSTHVRNVIARERPDLFEILERGFFYASRPADRVAGDLPVSAERIPVFTSIEQAPACFYLPISVRTAEAAGQPMTPLEREALSFVNDVANRPDVCIEMDLAPGDIQLLNNRRILHGRNDYTDASSPNEKREMLRLWLMMADWPARPANQNFHGVADRAAGGIPARG